jgi:hypothetical protein
MLQRVQRAARKACLCLVSSLTSLFDALLLVTHCRFIACQWCDVITVANTLVIDAGGVESFSADMQAAALHAEFCDGLRHACSAAA